MKIWIIFAIVLAVLIIAMLYLYQKGQKLQKEQDEQKEKIMSAAQQVTLLIIDKKRMPLNEAGLPQAVMDATPKRMRRAKVPVVKAKIGPRVTTLLADEDVYDRIPVKAQVKAMLSGIYITDINLSMIFSYKTKKSIISDRYLFKSSNNSNRFVNGGSSGN